MLIEFRVENHCSIRTEQALSMEAGRVGDETDPRPRRVEGHDTPLLPVVALYGANASGKSNVLSAFDFMRDAVLWSHRFWDSDGGVPRNQFAWGEAKELSSMFEQQFLLDGTRYEYGFVVNDNEVEEEWLFAWPKGRKALWFEREGQVFRFGDKLEGPNDVMKQVTRENSLFLSIASQHHHAQLSSIYGWFSRSEFANIDRKTRRIGFAAIPSSAMRRFNSDARKGQWREATRLRILELLRAADIGVSDFKIEIGDEIRNSKGLHAYDLKFRHSLTDENAWLELSEESKGTQTLFRLAIPLLEVLDEGGLLVVDELESSLHPLIGRLVVSLFNSPKTNAKNAQLVFTTHDTNLLAPMQGDTPLRRDQVWLTEKDSQGDTKVYPLTDFKPRKEENLERGYLQGRYGAIPFLGDLSKLTETDHVASKS